MIRGLRRRIFESTDEHVISWLSGRVSGQVTLGSTVANRAYRVSSLSEFKLILGDLAPMQNHQFSSAELTYF